jgi:soluble lytic murein transglycosylase-like protein
MLLSDRTVEKLILYTSVLLLVFMLQMAKSYAMCWEKASQHYGISSALLKAIAKTESNFNSSAHNQNNNKTYDIGLMQINSSWLPILSEYGITEASLQDACINVIVGAWILKQEQLRYGNTWKAVGAYHTGAATHKTESKKLPRMKEYAWKVHNNLHRSGHN